MHTAGYSKTTQRKRSRPQTKDSSGKSESEDESDGIAEEAPKRSRGQAGNTKKGKAPAVKKTSTVVSGPEKKKVNSTQPAVINSECFIGA